IHRLHLTGVQTRQIFPPAGRVAFWRCPRQSPTVPPLLHALFGFVGYSSTPLNHWSSLSFGVPAYRGLRVFSDRISPSRGLFSHNPLAISRHFFSTYPKGNQSPPEPVEYL